jgi:peptidoglycan/xylan/chitin deacetylase (PgdA/CDA1 family)
MIRVLAYHRIVPDDVTSVGPQLCLAVSMFRKHLQMLERWGFTSITFEDYRLHLDHGLALPRFPVVITFDDAYAETYDLAFPLLREFGMKAVVFAVGDRSLMTNVWDVAEGAPASVLMSDQQLLEMHAAGFEIGSHSLSHRHLASIPADEAWDQISRSRMKLEILLNSTVSTFAYPYGEVTPELKAMVARAGYSFACASYTGPPTVVTDHLEMRRITIVESDGVLQFTLKILAPYKHYRWLWWKLTQALKRDLTPVDLPWSSGHSDRS